LDAAQSVGEFWTEEMAATENIFRWTRGEICVRIPAEIPTRDAGDDSKGEAARLGNVAFFEGEDAPGWPSRIGCGTSSPEISAERKADQAAGVWRCVLRMQIIAGHVPEEEPGEKVCEEHKPPQR
jgi:hypothetical protein